MKEVDEFSARLAGNTLAVVIPCYRVKRHVLGVVERIGREVDLIFAIDDACPEGSGHYLEKACTDPRLQVAYHTENRGVGGAVMTGYRLAVAAGASVIVKIDGDGQMAPELLRYFVLPILAGEADYAKGNRFYDLSNIGQMPAARIFGNATLSFMAKLSTGYWDLFDPTNGYTAISGAVARHLPYEKISNRYFFETDLLFRLNAMRAAVIDIPMDAQYGNEASNLKIRQIMGEFLYKHLRNGFKRIFYNYFLRDVSIATLELVVGTVLMVFGVAFGTYHWFRAASDGIPTSAGTVMVAALPVILGIQLLLGFLSYDISTVPKRALHLRIPRAIKTATASLAGSGPSDEFAHHRDAEAAPKNDDAESVSSIERDRQ